MRKTIVLALTVAGLSLAGCAKHDDTATANSDTTVVNDDLAGGDVLGNGGDLADNTALPADDNLSTPAVNATDAGDVNGTATDTGGNTL